MPETAGRKEVVEATLQAALVALATGLAQWGLRELEEARKRRRSRHQDAKNAKKAGEAAG